MSSQSRYRSAKWCRNRLCKHHISAHQYEPNRDGGPFKCSVPDCPCTEYVRKPAEETKP